jgi:hypothetical protein
VNPFINIIELVNRHAGTGRLARHWVYITPLSSLIFPIWNHQGIVDTVLKHKGHMELCLEMLLGISSPDKYLRAGQYIDVM